MDLSKILERKKYNIIVICSEKVWNLIWLKIEPTLSLRTLLEAQYGRD